MSQGYWPQTPQIINPALGNDLGGIFDLTASMQEVSGRLCLVQNLARRIITPRGRVIDDLNYGFDLTAFLNADVSPRDIARMTAAVQAEFLKDERVIAANVTLQFVGPSQVTAAQSGQVSNPLPYPQGVIIVAAQIVDGQGPFNLTLAVTQLTVQLLQMG